MQTSSETLFQQSNISKHVNILSKANPGSLLLIKLPCMFTHMLLMKFLLIKDGTAIHFTQYTICQFDKHILSNNS